MSHLSAAYKSSKYLSGLIEQNRIHPEESEELESIFKQSTASTTSPEAIIKSPSAGESKVASTEQDVEALSRPSQEVNQRQQDSTAMATPTSEQVDGQLLLVSERIPLLMDAMEFPEWVRADLRRAKLQIEKAIKEDKLAELEHEAKDAVPAESAGPQQHN